LPVTQTTRIRIPTWALFLMIFGNPVRFFFKMLNFFIEIVISNYFNA